VKTVIIAAMAWASASWAQSGPTIAPYTLEVTRSPKGSPPSATDELRTELRKLLRDGGVVMPNSASLSETIVALRRQDCDRENACLSSLALRSQSLYALYASIDTELGDVVVVTGRVVRDDGLEMGRVKGLSAKATGKTFVTVGKGLLAKLVAELKVSSLEPTRPVAKPEPLVTTKPSEPEGGVVVAAAPDVGAQLSLPPPTPPEGSPLKTVGFVTAGVGVAAAIAGGVLFGVGSGSVRQINDDGAVVPGAGQSPEDAVKSYRQATTLQPAGLGLLIGGVAAGVAGLALGLATPGGGTTRISVVPAPGGPFIGVSGEWP
jgi:hypothetical protein